MLAEFKIDQRPSSVSYFRHYPSLATLLDKLSGTLETPASQLNMGTTTGNRPRADIGPSGAQKITARHAAGSSNESVV